MQMKFKLTVIFLVLLWSSLPLAQGQGLKVTSIGYNEGSTAGGINCNTYDNQTNCSQSHVRNVTNEVLGNDGYRYLLSCTNGPLFNLVGTCSALVPGVTLDAEVKRGKMILYGEPKKNGKRSHRTFFITRKERYVNGVEQLGPSNLAPGAAPRPGPPSTIANLPVPPKDDSDCDHMPNTEAEGYLQARVWISRHPEFNPTAENAKMLTDYLVSQNLCPSQANVDKAYAAVKSKLR
jgi:hypothetical protein